MRNSAIIVTQATGVPLGLPDLRASSRIGVIVSEWHPSDQPARNLPVDAVTTIVTIRGTLVHVRESFHDIAALLGAAEGEPR